MTSPVPTRAGYQRAAAGIVGCLLIGGSLGLKMQQWASLAPGEAVPAPVSPPESFSGAEEADYLALRRQVYRTGEDSVHLQPKIVTYTVQPGDSLWEIAYALDTPVEVLQQLNQGVRPSRLKPGQTLRVVSGSQGERRRTAQMVASRSAEEMTRGSRGEPAAAEIAPSTAPPEADPVTLAKASGPWIWPVNGGLISSEFGPRWGTVHEGIDIAVETGTTAVAAQGGTVIFAGWDGGYGYCVVIDHGNGVQSRYAHASTLLVSTGDTVEQGTPLLEVGSTGNSTGPHLHFEVMVDGTAYSPRLFLP